MISTLRLLRIWLRGGIPAIEKYDRKAVQSPLWVERFAVDFRDGVSGLDTQAWTIIKRKAALEGLYGQYDQYDIPVPEQVKCANGSLSLLASPASVEGIQWHKTYGFIKASCECAGGYVASLQDLNIKRGKVMMRAHWKDSADFMISAALESDKRLPFLEIFTLSKHWRFGYCDQKVRKEVILPRFLLKEGRSYEFELQWSEREMRWKVNGMELLRIRRRFPPDMYFSATIALVKKINTITPGSFGIESFRIQEKIKKMK